MRPLSQLRAKIVGAPLRQRLRAATRRAGGWCLGGVLLFWVRSWRIRWVASAGDGGSSRRMLCFWHGRQMPLLAYAGRRGVVVMVSWSNDGALQAGILSRLGMRVVRGSSSRGAASGLRAVVRGMEVSGEGAFAVDGPHGPERKAKPGALRAARLSGALLVPLGAAATPSWCVRAGWEQFLVPWPFARVVVVEGPPIDPDAPEALVALESAISGAERVAESLLRGWRGGGEPRGTLRPG